jgi:hypothetical protein
MLGWLLYGWVSTTADGEDRGEVKVGGAATGESSYKRRGRGRHGARANGALGCECIPQRSSGGRLALLQWWGRLEDRRGGSGQRVEKLTGGWGSTLTSSRPSHAVRASQRPAASWSFGGTFMSLRAACRYGSTPGPKGYYPRWTWNFAGRPTTLMVPKYRFGQPDHLHLDQLSTTSSVIKRTRGSIIWSEVELISKIAKTSYKNRGSIIWTKVELISKII